MNFAPIERVLENTGLTLSALDDADNIDVSVALTIAHNLNKHSYTSLWPTLFGTHLGLTGHGPVGYASLSAPTLGKALSTFVEWERVRTVTYIGKISEKHESFEITINDTTRDPVYKAFFFEAFVRALEILMSLILGGPPLQKTTIHFEAVAKSKQKIMREMYDSMLYFGTDTNTLLVPKSLWFIRSPLYDKESHEFNLRKCQQLFEQINQYNPIDSVVRNIIRKHFDQTIIATTSPEPPPTQRQICSQLHTTERTLIRRLKECDTSYKQILQEERRQYAQLLLKNTQYTVFNISEILGYGESANFCRAFKKWFGQSPSAYRRNPNINRIHLRRFTT